MKRIDYLKQCVQSLHPVVNVVDEDVLPRELEHYNAQTLSEPPVTIQSDPVYDVIYIPNEHGFPGSDLSVSRKQLQDPSVMIAIEQNLRQQIPSSGAETPEDAFDAMKLRHESNEQYADRLKNFLRNSYKAHVAQEEAMKNVEPKPE